MIIFNENKLLRESWLKRDTSPRYKWAGFLSITHSYAQVLVLKGGGGWERTEGGRESKGEAKVGELRDDSGMGEFRGEAGVGEFRNEAGGVREEKTMRKRSLSYLCSHLPIHTTT